MTAPRRSIARGAKIRTPEGQFFVTGWLAKVQETWFARVMCSWCGSRMSRARSDLFACPTCDLKGEPVEVPTA